MSRCHVTLLTLALTLASPVSSLTAEPLPVWPVPIEAQALDACTDGAGTVHVAALQHGKVVHLARPSGGDFGKPAALPCESGGGGHGGAVQIVSAGARILVMAPARGGFCLAASDDGGRTWQARSSLDVTGHEALESGRMAASGSNVHVVWINEEAEKDAHDKVASPLFYAASRDGGRTFSKPRAVTEAFPRACPCCPTTLVANGDTVRIAYRTSVKNVKEVGLLTSRDGGQTFAFRQVSDDKWEMLGCPANGPTLGISGDKVVMTWTAEKAIQTATSADGGATFTAPQPVGAGRFHFASADGARTVAVVQTAAGTAVSRGAGVLEPLTGTLTAATALLDVPGQGAVLLRAR